MSALLHQQLHIHITCYLCSCVLVDFGHDGPFLHFLHASFSALSQSQATELLWHLPFGSSNIPVSCCVSSVPFPDFIRGATHICSPVCVWRSAGLLTAPSNPYLCTFCKTCCSSCSSLALRLLCRRTPAYTCTRDLPTGSFGRYHSTLHSNQQWGPRLLPTACTCHCTNIGMVLPDPTLHSACIRASCDCCCGAACHDTQAFNRRLPDLAGLSQYLPGSPSGLGRTALIVSQIQTWALTFEAVHYFILHSRPQHALRKYGMARLECTCHQRSAAAAAAL